MSSVRLLSFIGLIAAFAGWYVFVPRWPSPTGPGTVGRLDATIRSPGGGSISVTVWYPQAMGAPAPVILYSPGWGGTRTQSRAQIESLASHGFVVVACDDIASDPATDPDGGIFLQLESDAETAATIQRAGRHAALQADRLLAILDGLAAGQISLPVAIELRRVGILGYSIGGTSGVAAAARDRRIVAVLNLDGGLFGPAADEIDVEMYLLFSSKEAFPTDAELASADAFVRNYARISALDIPRHKRRMERAGGYWVQIPAADHADLSDELFAASRRRLFRTNIERRAIHTSIQALEVAFFRHALIGDAASLQALLGQSDQTIRWISPNSPPPGAARARQ